MKFKVQRSEFKVQEASRFLWLALAVMFLPQAASACSVCFGNSDSDLAKGFTWGVLTLLFVVFCVLGGFTAFFIYMAKRSAAMSQNAVSPLADATQKVSNG